MTETYLGWNVPTAPTLKKYGLSVEEWQAIVDRQGGVCPIMGYVPESGGGVIDHEHVKGWKKMAPEERKKYVRGFVSRWANGKYLARGLNVERAEAVVRYLQAHESRKAGAAPCGCPDECTEAHYYCRCRDGNHTALHWPPQEES